MLAGHLRKRTLNPPGCLESGRPTMKKLKPAEESSEELPPLMAGFRMGASGNVPFIILELVL
jgi:hypothetical protein